MNELLNKFENKWFLSILRDDLKTVNWFLSSPEEINNAIENFDLSKLTSITFKEARPLLKVARVAYDAPEKNSVGLPILTIFAHKKFIS